MKIVGKLNPISMKNVVNFVGIFRHLYQLKFKTGHLSLQKELLVRPGSIPLFENAVLWSRYFIKTLIETLSNKLLFFH